MLRAGEEVRDVAADHVPDRRLRRHVRPRLRRDQPAVAEHGHAVCDLEDLFEAMADEEDRDAAPGELTDLGEQALHLVRGQRGRRLVHDQDADVQRDRLRDLDRLLRGDREAARRRPWVQAHVERGENRLGLAVHLPPVDDRAALPVADEDVLGDVEVGEDRRLLVDRGEPVALGVRRAAQRDRLPGDRDRPRVRRVDARHDLDQRRLAGAVLPEEGVYLARVQRQRDAVQRLRRVEALRDPVQLQDGRRLDRRCGGAHRGYAAVTPPSTLTTLPVDFPDRGPAKKTIASATSSGKTLTPSTVRRR